MRRDPDVSKSFVWRHSDGSENRVDVLGWKDGNGGGTFAFVDVSDNSGLQLNRLRDSLIELGQSHFGFEPERTQFVEQPFESSERIQYFVSERDLPSDIAPELRDQFSKYETHDQQRVSREHLLEQGMDLPLSGGDLVEAWSEQTLGVSQEFRDNSNAAVTEHLESQRFEPDRE